MIQGVLWTLGSVVWAIAQIPSAQTDVQSESSVPLAEIFVTMWYQKGE